MGPAMVEICRGECVINAVSSASARFQLNAGKRWSNLVTPRLPFSASCIQSCAEFGGDPDPKSPKRLYAEKQPEAYSIARSDGQIITIPGLGTMEEPLCLMPSSKSGMPSPCGGLKGLYLMDLATRGFGSGGFSAASSSRFGAQVENRDDDPPIQPPSTAHAEIGGRVLMPDGAAAPSTVVRIVSVRDPRDYVSGRWVTASGVQNAPWVITLVLRDGQLLGTVDQTVNGSGAPQPIEQGSFGGDEVWFKVSDLANAKRRVTFVGAFKSSKELTLSRNVAIPPGGAGSGPGIWSSDGPAVFTARRDDKPFEASTQTDASGQYRFDNLPPGLYRIAATSGGVTASPSGASSPEPAPIAVAPGDRTFTLNFTLAAPAAKRSDTKRR